jgi:hypothetical protein
MHIHLVLLLLDETIHQLLINKNKGISYEASSPCLEQPCHFFFSLNNYECQVINWHMSVIVEYNVVINMNLLLIKVGCH